MERQTRTERDSMGAVEVPAEAYYGAETARAMINFPISGLRFPRAFIRALGLLKQAAAEVNVQLGLLPPALGAAIVQAAQEVARGDFDDQFVVDVYQTGSGTSTNMNANEVIANRANELLGEGRGAKRPVHPNDHVNRGQSSNDVIPTTIHLAALTEMKERLLPSLALLEVRLTAKAQEFDPIVKTGRTHLQDATPVSLGQEFHGYAGQVERCLARIERAMSALSEVALGGTAVGTGLNAHPDFPRLVCQRLSELAAVDVRETDNHFQAQSTLDAVLEASAALRGTAVSLMKIANDIRWLGSGPRAGLGELTLPEVQPGSSIMPGKVNPVIIESLLQACAQVIGNDATIATAAQWGNFELNTMMPVAGHNLLQSIGLLAASARNFAERCVAGLQATNRGPELVEKGLALATALAPLVGYDQAAAIAREAAATGRTIREVARERTALSDEELARALDPRAMLRPNAITRSDG